MTSSAWEQTLCLSGQMHKYRATPLWMLAFGLYADIKLDGPSSL